MRGDELADRLLEFTVQMLSDDLPATLYSEAGELCAILGQSILTAKGKGR